MSYSSPEPKSCSVAYNYRPLRIAFLIDPSQTSEELLNGIIKFSVEKWGGRYYPIVPCDGSSIPESYWSLLEFVDPDIICSYVKIDDALLDRIDRATSPMSFHIRVIDEDNKIVFSDADMESPLPNEFLMKDLHRLFRAPFYLMKPKLAVFKIQRSTENYSFILNNFGHLQNLVNQYMKAGDKKWRIELKDEYRDLDIVEIDVERSIDDVLRELGGYKDLIFPFHLSGAATRLPLLDYKQRDSSFLIGIGDDVETYLYLWNRVHFLNGHPGIGLSQILIPDDLYGSADVLEAIKGLLKGWVYHDTNKRYDMEIVSASRSEKELSEFVGYLKSGTYWSVKARNSKENFAFPTIDKQRVIQSDLGKSGSIHHFSDTTTYIPNIGPVSIQDTPDYSARKWVLDMDVSYRPERFFYTNVNYLWTLPQRPGLTYLFEKRLSKVTNHGSIAFVVGSNEKSVEISIPSDKAVFHQLISPYYQYMYTSDARPKRVSEYKEIRLSDKGRYLNGLLDLFPSLWHAHRCFSEHFWRKTFYQMCNMKRRKGNNQLLQLQGKIRKVLRQKDRTYPGNEDQISETLSLYLQSLMREEEYDHPLTFDTMLASARNEREMFLASQENREQFQYTEEQLGGDLRESLQDLVDSNIVFPGIRPRCSHCGFRNWYDLNEVTTDLICKGCHTKFRFPAESVWFYKLNELIKKTILYQGVLAVLMCLGHLLDNSRRAFIFVPSISLYKEYDDDDPVSELDIVCISDGSFIIGEVKHSGKLFSENDFRRMEENAKKLQPDKVVMFSMEGPYEKPIELTYKLKESLAQHGIDAEFIKPWDYIHSPSYHLNPF